MTDIVLVVPPNTFGAEPGMLSDRMGIDYLLAVSRRAGWSAEMVHCPASKLDVAQTVQAVVSQAPSLVGVTSAASRHDLTTMGHILAGVRDGLPGAHLCVGGYAATFAPEDIGTAFPEVDAVVRGEGEATFLDLAGRVLAGRAWRDIAGITARHEGRMVANPARPLLDDLDALPLPARDFLALGAAPMDSPALISSSRGCYGTCAFCSIHRFYRQSPGKVWRGRSPANVVDEIAWLKRQWGIRRIQFVDDHFLGSGRRGRERAAEIARELLRRKLRIEFFIEARADTVEEELFTLLKHAGLKAVFLGIESAVQETLDRYRKQTSVEINLRALDVLDRLGLGVAPGLITFDPFLTPADLRENVRFLRRSGLADQKDIFFFFGSSLNVYSGTEMETLLEERGLLAEAQKKHARECINIRDYRFADPRTEMLFQVTSALRQELMRRYHAADAIAGYHTQGSQGWTANGQGPWLREQNYAILDLLDQAVDAAEGPSGNAEFVDDWTQRGLKALREIDLRYWNAPFDSAQRQLLASSAGPGRVEGPGR